MRRRVRFCAARAESQRILRRDKMFAARKHSCFKVPGQRKKHGSRLIVNEQMTSDVQLMKEAWLSHFEKLAKSSSQDNDKCKEDN